MPLLRRRPAPAPDATVAYVPPPVAAEQVCPNCSTPAPLAYCPACGQAQHALHRSVRSIAAEFLDTFAGWDGKIPVTLWTLVRHPGRLTADYAAGRRARYLPPLRLYLLASLVLVLVFQVRRPALDGFRLSYQPESAVDVATRSPAADARAAASAGQLPTESGPWQKMKRTYFGDRLKSLEHMSKAEQRRAVREALFTKLGKMFFALLPVFAAIVGLLHWRGPLVYAEHFVFALHVHALAALALALALGLAATPWPVAAAVPLVWVPAYVFAAMRRVYRGSRRRTLGKYVLLGGAYSVALLAALVVTMLAAVLVG